MAYTANTVLRGRPATIEVTDAGIVSLASDGSKWEFNAELQPRRYTRSDGDSMTFSQMKDGQGFGAPTFNGRSLPATPVNISNTPTLQSFLPVLQAISDASDAPGFPQQTKAKLVAGFETLGQTGRSI